MNSERRIFSKSRGSAGWFATCGLFAAVLYFGNSSGFLTEACLALIAGYASYFGVLPYFAGKRELDDDVVQCSPETDDLSAAPSNQARKLLAQDDRNAGSVHITAKTLTLAKDRCSKESAIEAVLECYDEHWDFKVKDLNDVAVYCQFLGLGGTTLGIADIAQVLEANTGNVGVGSAIATMSLTTLAGGGAFVLISGLARRLERAVAQQRKDLHYVAAMFKRDGDQSSPHKRSDNPFSQPGAAK